MDRLRRALRARLHRHACLLGAVAGAAVGCTAASAGSGPPAPALDLVSLTGDPTTALALGAVLQVLVSSPGWAALGLIGYAVVRHGMPRVPLDVELVMRPAERADIRAQLERLQAQLEERS